MLSGAQQKRGSISGAVRTIGIRGIRLHVQTLRLLDSPLIFNSPKPLRDSAPPPLHSPRIALVGLLYLEGGNLSERKQLKHWLCLKLTVFGLRALGFRL